MYKCKSRLDTDTYMIQIPIRQDEAQVVNRSKVYTWWWWCWCGWNRNFDADASLIRWRVVTEIMGIICDLFVIENSGCLYVAVHSGSCLSSVICLLSSILLQGSRCSSSLNFQAYQPRAHELATRQSVVTIHRALQAFHNPCKNDSEEVYFNFGGL